MKRSKVQSHALYALFALVAFCASLAASCSRAPLVPIDEVFVPGGSFTVGDDVYCGRYDSRVGDLHASKYEITWDVFAEVMNYAIGEKLAFVRDGRVCPTKGKYPQFATSIVDLAVCRDRLELRDGKIAVVGDSSRLPVSMVGWYGAAFFCNALSLANGRVPCYDWDFWEIVPKANGYRMPTYEEWEYLARGGAKGGSREYAGSDDPTAVAWFVGNSGNAPHPVGELLPNELGLYDMNGNVSEFCSETFRSIITSKSDVSSPLKTSNRIWRGGSFMSATVPVTYFYQNINNPDYYLPFPDVGFRVVSGALPSI